MLEITQKVIWTVLNIIFLFSKRSKNIFVNIWGSKMQIIKNENIEIKYIKNMQKSQFLKVKISVLELEKDFVELKDKELRDRELKLKER